MKPNAIFDMMIAAAVCLGITSCDDYFQKLNRPHGALTEEDLDRDNLRQGSMIPTMEELIVPQSNNGSFQHCESLVGDVWGRTLMCKPGGNGGAWSGDLSWFHPDGDHWLSNPFTSTMAFYRPYVETWGFTNHDSGNSIWALARIMRVATMHRLADMYGPIPYTKIDPTDLDLYIPYDKEEVVWTTMLEELSTAIDDLRACITGNNFSDIKKFDRIYQGNGDQWLRYANSLLLRLAVRVSNIRPDLTQLYAQKAIDGGVIESNTDNAMLNMRIENMTDIGSKLYVIAYSSYNDTFAAADLVCYMDGYNDARRSAYFTTYKGENKEVMTPVYAGLRAGSKGSDTQVREICSRPAVGQYDNYPLLTAAEVAFLRAECVLNRWTSDCKTAQEFYEEGIRLSFNQWGAAGAESYLSDAESTPANFVDYLGLGEDTETPPSTITIAWKDDGKELQRIITQKYIALYPLGHEVWCDYRRTRFPEFLPIVSGKTSSNMKVAERLKFSVNESLTNSENLEEAKTFLYGGDDYSTKLWWAKK